MKARAYRGGYIVPLKMSPTMEGRTFGVRLIRVIFRICIRLHAHGFYKDFQPRGFGSR